MRLRRELSLRGQCVAAYRGVGDVNMDGLNFAIVLRTPKGEKTGDAFFSKHELDLLTVYFDGSATPAQKAAMPELMAGLLGTQPMKGFRPPQFAAMKLVRNGDLATFDIADGSKLSFEIENINLDKINPSGPRSNPGNRITLTNVAPFPWIKNVTQGHSMHFRYNDFDTKWEYANRNAFFGTVLASGIVPSIESKP